MRYQTLSIVALASSAIASSSIILPRELHQFLPLEARQVSGDQYACHEDCGYTILDAIGDYCSNSTWVSGFEGCMACANDFGIWQWYRDGVTGAAESCGLDATPDPAGGDGDEEDDNASTTEAPATTAAPSTTASPTTEAADTSAESSATTETPVTTGTEAPTYAPSTVPATGTETTASASTTVGASASVSPTYPAVPTTTTIGNSTIHPNATSSITPTVSVITGASGTIERNSAVALSLAAIAAIVHLYQN